jgi:hypothetical protein
MKQALPEPNDTKVGHLVLAGKTDENRSSGDAKTRENGNLDHVKDRAEYDRCGKLTSDYGDRQRGHGDSKDSKR